MPKTTTERKTCCFACHFDRNRNEPHEHGGCGASCGCSCHTTTENGWEERFDELPLAVAYQQMGDQIVDFDYLKVQMNEIVKPFIQQIAKEEYERGRADMVSHAKGHYWDSVQEHRDTIIQHVEQFIEHMDAGIGEPAALETPNKESL